jgi:hypothetical protein
MLWLFGQIWLWSLISFALGAAVTALLLTRVNRERAKPQPAPSANEPQREYPRRRPLEWPSDPIERIDTGHHLGMPPPAQWPPDQRTEQIEAIQEPAWPRAEDWPSTEHRPGRGG